MKKNILTIAFLLACITVFGQEKNLRQLPNFDKQEMRWGFYFGLSQQGYKVTYKESTSPDATVNIKSGIGFNIGLVGDFRINKYFSLITEPGLMSSKADVYFINNPEQDESIPSEASGTYLHIPVLLKFNGARMTNARPFVIGGFSYDYNLTSQQNSPDDNSNGVFRMQTHNFMYEIGVGMDFYFHYFKFSPSLRGQFAITNEIKYDEDPNSPYTAPIDFLGTKGVFLRLAFE